MSEMEEALRAILEKDRFLTARGREIRLGDGAEFRIKLERDVAGFERAISWLWLVPARGTVNRDFDSYCLKHEAERFAGGYVSNGALIAAAIHLGFAIEDIYGSRNVRVAVSGRSKWPKNGAAS